MPMDSASVLSKSYVFDPRPRFPFRIVAKRYWIGKCPDAVSKTREDVLTLVFLPGGGANKELWEPTIHRLFQNQQTVAPQTVRFQDMWSLDMLNQGDSAIVNEEILLCGYDIFSWEHHARGVHAFLAGLGTGVDVDFSKRKLALVSHSMGGPVSMLATTYHPLLEISSLHLTEPFLVGDEGQDLLPFLCEMSGKRRVVWPSSEEALEELRTRSSFSVWDERVQKMYVKHGLRPLPTAEYPDLKEGVTTKCTRKQEVKFRHITFGALPDAISSEAQYDVLHVASGGITNFASVTSAPEAGHMMLETHPDVVADIIWKSSTQSYESPVVAKL